MGTECSGLADSLAVILPDPFFGTVGRHNQQGYVAVESLGYCRAVVEQRRARGAE